MYYWCIRVMYKGHVLLGYYILMLLLVFFTTGVITVCYYCGTYQLMYTGVLLGAVLLGCIYHSSTRDVYTGATTAGYYYTMVCSPHTAPPHQVLLHDVLPRDVYS